MPRVCSICAHTETEAIDRALVDGGSFRSIASRFGVSTMALQRHKNSHLSQLLAENLTVTPVPVPATDSVRRSGTAIQQHAGHRAASERDYALDILAQIGRQLERLNRLSDAVDEWLRDPDDPSRYSIDPRAEDVLVIYRQQIGEIAEGVPLYGARRKERLSVLLGRIEGQNLEIEATETKHADPRELLIKAGDGLKSQLALLVTVLEKIYNAREIEAFMQAVLDGISEVEPNVRAAIEHNLRQRRALRSVAGPAQR